MKRYSLLRNNRESGPYTIRELKTLGLATTDLIWIEGESLSWSHPTDIDELKPIAAKGIKISLASEPEKTSPKHEERISFAIPSNASSSSTYADVNKTPNTTEDYSIYLAEKEKPLEWKPTRQKRSLAEVGSSFFGLGVLLVGVMMCAFVVKKLVEHFDIEQPLFSAEAVEITKEQLPVNTSNHAAKTVQLSTVAAVPGSDEPAPVEALTSAITKPVVTNNANEAEKEAAELTAKTVSNEEVKTANLTVAVKEEPSSEKAEEKPAEKVQRKAPSLTLSANEYKVGVFGGISDLELAISNPSSVDVESAVVEIEYLKPNGSVVKSQTMTVENISAGGAKKLPVPASSRGVKVRYHVVSVQSADEKIAATDM